MPAPIFLPVVLMKRIDFTWDLDVVALGVGIVVKNTARFTMTLRQANVAKLQKTTTTLSVVAKSLDSKRKTIVRAVIQGIVGDDGKQPFS